MSVRREIPEPDGIYFITFTCSQWTPLFEIANGYDLVYTWFDYLKSKGHFICGYVIMPNHIHALIGFRNTEGKSINTIIGNGKRFMAYGIIKKLQEKDELQLLEKLSARVNATDRSRHKLHEVFEPSFDWKECWSKEITEQKLNYIHANPCQGKWNLANEEENYLHSSAKYYATGEQGIYDITSYTELEDIDLTRPGRNEKLKLQDQDPSVDT